MRARLVASDMDVGGRDAYCATMDFEINPRTIRHDGEFVDAARAAVKEFLTTKDGEDRVNEFSYFDWGDAIEWVPREIWEKHGLKPIDELPYLIGNVDYHEDFS